MGNDDFLRERLNINLSELDIATNTIQEDILAELENKADLTETQPVSLDSVPLAPNAATETTLQLLSTIAKQNEILVALSNILSELQEKTTPSSPQLIELQTYMKLLLQVISAPSYVDLNANQLRAQVTISSGTVTTVSTVSNQSQIDGFQARLLIQDMNFDAWYNGVRGRIA